MRTQMFFAAALVALGLLATPAPAAPEGWHTTLEAGVAAAEKSGKPILLITAWTRKL